MYLLTQRSRTPRSRRFEVSVHLVAALWLALFSVGPQLAVAGEPQYEVRGIMQQIDRDGGTRFFCDFWVAVSGRRSLVRVVYFNGETLACGTDGIDSYSINEMVPVTRQKGAGTLQFADISAGPFPRMTLTPLQMTWLAYASGGSLREKDNELPMKCYQDAAEFTKSEVGLLTSPPYLPKSVKWWGPNFLVLGNERRHHPLPDYPQGYLAGTYSIGATTHFDGNELPLQWKLEFYQPDFQKQHPIAGRDDVVPCGALIATITNVSTLEYTGDYLPSIGTQPVQIIEHRLEKKTGYAQQYSVVNGVALTHWPKRDDPYFVRLSQNASPMARLWRSSTGRSYLPGLILLGAVGLLAGALCVLLWWSKEGTSQQKPYG